MTKVCGTVVVEGFLLVLFYCPYLCEIIMFLTNYPILD